MLMHAFAPDEEADDRAVAAWREANRGGLTPFLLEHLPRCMRATYIDTWLDTPHPSLGLRTPRAAVAAGDATPVESLVGAFLWGGY